jgi:hypothetical protein
MAFIVDFESAEDMNVTTKFMGFMEKIGVCRFTKLYNLEHWFSDIMIVEYELTKDKRD